MQNWDRAKHKNNNQMKQKEVKETHALNLINIYFDL